MYDQFYRFNSEPFRLSPDHAFAYAHKGYIKARAYMAYAFMREEGFVMVTGRPGTGKTTLVGALIEHLSGENVRVANLVCSQLKADDLLKLVAYEFGVAVDVVEKGELLQRLTQQLRAWHRDGRRALLIVDEAQDLAVSAMEELRLLTNIQVAGKPLLQIFLLGQPELRELVLRPELEQVHQRIVAASHLKSLELEETREYILHRLDVVGWRGDPAFSQAVFPLVYKFSEGIPRRINLICSRLLLHCALEQRHRVEVADVREVIGELQDEHLAAGASWSEADFHGLEDTPDEAPAAAQGDADPEVAGAHDTGQRDAGEIAVGDAGRADDAVQQQPEQQVVRGRQHLTVVAGAAGVTARRTGTDESVPAPIHGHVETEVAVTAAVDAMRATETIAPAPAPASTAQDAASDQPSVKGRPAPGGATVASGRTRRAAPAKKGRVTKPTTAARRGHSAQSPGGELGGGWVIGGILLASIALVAWAATGFSFGFFLE
tara:strand:- start:40659 stop:42131 length:1473 start_codon:yes stop_codon:yes gene_type:complete